MKEQVSSSHTDFATGISIINSYVINFHILCYIELRHGILAGIQSFNVIGLGYKVDWPVSIVLTPGALDIYAQIFSFLIKVKLALSSLTQVWCSFKV